MSAREEYNKSKTAFEAVPAGTYDVTITEAKVIPFANTGQYANKKALNLKLRVIDDAPVGAKRVFFLRVPLFDKFFPTAKNPQGALAFGYFQFADAIGIPEERQIDGWVPEFQAYAGKRIAATIKHFAIGSKGQEFHVNKETGEEEAWNEVGNIYPARKKSATASTTVAGGDTDVWGTQAASAEPPVDAWATEAPQDSDAPVDPWAPDAALAAAVGASAGL